MVFLSPQKGSVVNNSGSEASAVIAELSNYTRSSYAVMDSGWKYMYDKYNDKYRWIPCNADVAGCCVTADISADPWFSPAGYARGVIKNAAKLAYSPNKADRDALYKAGINPIVGFPGNGIVLFGDKTLLAKASAFNRINVRRLFITVEKAIATAAKFQLFEFNDSFTRAQFRSLVSPFLRDVQGRRGVYDFRVVCDETNNTPEVIDQNQFRADIFLKPAKSINFITLTFVATRTGISFEELGA
jgi:phage tail sheath protein FI